MGGTPGGVSNFGGIGSGYSTPGGVTDSPSSGSSTPATPFGPINVGDNGAGSNTIDNQIRMTDAAAGQASQNANTTMAGSQDAYNKANDWLQTGGQSGKLASQGANSVAGTTAGTARSLGMNAAQSAKQGGQAGSADYNNIYNSVYGTGANAYANMGASQGNQSVGFSGVEGNDISNATNAQAQHLSQQMAQQGADQASTQATINDISTILGKL